MQKAKEITSRAFGFASVAIFAVLVVTTVWQVFTRQVLHSPSTWSEEFAKICFVWLSFLGAAFVFGERGHIAVDFLARKAPMTIQKTLQTLVQLTIIAFAVFGMVWGGFVRHQSRGTKTQRLCRFQSDGCTVIPLAGVAIALFAVVDMIAVLKGDEEPYPDTEELDEPRDLEEVQEV